MSPGAPAAGEWTTRPARLEDGPAIAGLLTELGYPHEPAEATQRLSDWSRDPRGIVLVAVAGVAGGTAGGGAGDGAGGVVGGFVAVQQVAWFERPGSFARVLALSVGGAHRRAGLGRLLLAAAEQWARERGCTEVELTSSRYRDSAHRFYRALGYEDQSERSARYKRRL